MASKPDLNSPIDDYLLSIAESLQRVQKQLNNSKVLSVDGQSYTSYHLPKLDFELKMSIQLETITEGDTQRYVFKAAPANTQKQSRSSSEITQASTIKGAFIAIPSDLGKPPPVNRTFIQKFSSHAFNVIINVQSVLGEPQAGIPVQYNIDRALSRDLNKHQVDWEKIYFDLGRVTTTNEGNASSLLNIETAEETKVAVIIDVLGKTETIIVKGRQTDERPLKLTSEQAAAKREDLLKELNKGLGGFFNMFGMNPNPEK